MSEFSLTSPTIVTGRSDADFYPTPRFCTQALIEHDWRWRPRAGEMAFDPACGEGAILDLYRERGCVTHGIELDPTRAAAAQKRGHRVDFGDALSQPWPLGAVLVGNPPYTLAGEFARRAAEWASASRGWAALLLRLSFLEPASGRAVLFERHRPDVLILPRRPAFDGRGHDSITSAWFCWPGEGRLVWLPP